jgi:hypothetical protein
MHKTLPYLYKALEVKEFLSDGQLLEIYKMLTDAEFQECHIIDCMEFIEMGLDLAKKCGNTDMIKEFESSKGYYGLYISKGIAQYLFEARDLEILKDFDTALKKYKKALQASEKYNDNRYMDTIKNSIAQLSRKALNNANAPSSPITQKNEKKSTKKTKKTAK